MFGLHWVGFEFSCCDDVSTFDFDFVPVAAVADFLATSQIIMNHDEMGCYATQRRPGVA